MSNKAIRNCRNFTRGINHVVSANNWCCGETFHHHTNRNFYTSFRVLVFGSNKKNKYGGFGGFYLRPEEYNKEMSAGKCRELNLDTGRLDIYCRNFLEFVSSRASRKHGIKPTKPSYLSKKERWEKEISMRAKTAKGVIVYGNARLPDTNIPVFGNCKIPYC